MANRQQRIEASRNPLLGKLEKVRDLQAHRQGSEGARAGAISKEVAFLADQEQVALADREAVALGDQGEVALADQEPSP